jgi:thiol:disulfide interchange protein
MSDNFCAKCGKDRSNITTTPVENKAASVLSKDSSNSDTNDKPRKNPLLYSFLYVGVGLAIIGCIAAILIPGLATGKSPSGQSLFVLSFWFGIATLIRGKQKDKSAWLWFFIGFLGIGLIVGFLLSFIIGFVK